MVGKLSKDEFKKIRRTLRKILEYNSVDNLKVYFVSLETFMGLFSLCIACFEYHDAWLMKTKNNGQKYP